ncbi:hypothetical protein MNBD_GAMMA26-2537 [hydrothermal vent metagenome]|uniref:Uncharacterized protein n=1 Tax=hydrothermal vent metagenome TaxID=652676 RepID=A0A3B1BLN4_9ZZZZ
MRICPYCRCETAIVSRTRGVVEKCGRVIGIVPFRCQHCYERFFVRTYAVVLGAGALLYVAGQWFMAPMELPPYNTIDKSEHLGSEHGVLKDNALFTYSLVLSSDRIAEEIHMKMEHSIAILLQADPGTSDSQQPGDYTASANDADLLQASNEDRLRIVKLSLIPTSSLSFKYDHLSGSIR